MDLGDAAYVRVADGEDHDLEKGEQRQSKALAIGIDFSRSGRLTGTIEPA